MTKSKQKSSNSFRGRRSRLTAVLASAFGVVAMTSHAGALDGGTVFGARQIGYGPNVATIANNNLIAIGIGSQVETSAGGGITLGSGLVNAAPGSFLVGNGQIGLDAGSGGSVVFNPAGAASSVYVDGNFLSSVAVNPNTGQPYIVYPSVFRSPNAFSFSSQGPVVRSTGAINLGGAVYDAAGGVALGTEAFAGVEGVTSTVAPTAVGNLARATGAGSTAIGASASVNQANGVALGTNASVTDANGVALGSDSRSIAAVAVQGATVSTSGTPLTFGGFAGTSNVSSVVSVGDAATGLTRQVVNVAPGAITQTSTDAINGSQLFFVTQGLGNRVNEVEQNFNNQVGAIGNQLTATNNRIDTLSGGPAASSNSAQNYVAPVTSGAEAVAIGSDATASGSNSAVFGNSAVAGGDNSTAVGNGAIASGGNSTALGTGAVASGTSSTALGSNASSSGTNSVALGSNSSDQGRSNVVSVGSPGNERQITNVAPGVNGTDAVNVNQLNQSVGAINGNLSALRGEINQNRRDANAGTAGAMAMAGMPQATAPGKNMVGAGVSHYDGESAVAVGLSKLSESGQWVTKLTGTVNTRGKVGIALGAGYQW